MACTSPHESTTTTLPYFAPSVTFGCKRFEASAFDYTCIEYSRISVEFSAINSLRRVVAVVIVIACEGGRGYEEDR